MYHHHHHHLTIITKNKHNCFINFTHHHLTLLLLSCQIGYRNDLVTNVLDIYNKKTAQISVKTYQFIAVFHQRKGDI